MMRSRLLGFFGVPALLGALACASAAFAQSATPPAADAKAGAASSPRRVRESVPRARPPTPEQLRAYEILRQEADEYERGAKEFRRTLTQIVRYHYEDRRRRVLAALDSGNFGSQRLIVVVTDPDVEKVPQYVQRVAAHSPGGQKVEKGPRQCGPFRGKVQVGDQQDAVRPGLWCHRC